MTAFMTGFIRHHTDRQQQVPPGLLPRQNLPLLTRLCIHHTHIAEHVWADAISTIDTNMLLVGSGRGLNLVSPHLISGEGGGGGSPLPGVGFAEHRLAMRY
jgi:hypothetical protein